jgi:glycosyltransferase involved in cell wall biosynthesis
MKVGVFCPTLNVYGGGEFVAIAIANALAENNHKVTFFSANRVDPKAIKNFYGEQLNLSIQSIVQPTPFTSRGLADFYQTILHSYIAKSKCNLFIDAFSNCVYPWTDISYIHYPFLNVHSYNKRFPYLGRPSLLLTGATPHIVVEKNLVSYNKKLVLANSHFTAQEIKKYQDKPVEVLYPPFPSTISAIGRATTKNNTENLVVTTSRLEYNKLLENIPLIAKKVDSNIHFAIIGRLCNKEVLTNLENLCKRLDLTNRISIYPNCPNQLKIDLLKRAKIYLHTMVGEHFGISIVEAMALGCVPIVHNSGGMVEFVPPRYRYESIQEAADKIKVEMQNWTSEKSREAQEISANFSYGKFSERFMNLFSQHFAF